MAPLHCGCNYLQKQDCYILPKFPFNFDEIIQCIVMSRMYAHIRFYNPMLQKGIGFS